MADELVTEIRAIVREAQRFAWLRGYQAGYDELGGNAPALNPYGPELARNGGFLCEHGLDLCVQCMEDKGLTPVEILEVVERYLTLRSGFPLTHTLE